MKNYKQTPKNQIKIKNVNSKKRMLKGYINPIITVCQGNTGKY